MRKTFPPKLNLSALANCAMFADKYRNIQTQTKESEFPKVSLNLDFENIKNETPNKRVKKCQTGNLKKVLKTRKVSIQASPHILHYVPSRHGFNRAINMTGFLAEFGYGK